MKLSGVKSKPSFDHSKVSKREACLGSALWDHFFKIVYFAGIIHRETGMFFGQVILLGSFFEKQVIGIEFGEEIMIFSLQHCTGKYEKSDPGTIQKAALERAGIGCAFGTSCRCPARVTFAYFWITCGSLFDTEFDAF